MRLPGIPSSRGGRTTLAALTLSAAGIVGLALHEGYREEAYVPIPGDRPTIGFGSTHGVKPGDRTTPVQALIRMQAELATEYEPALKACVEVPLYQEEYDIYVNMLYNIGATKFCGSTMVKRLNAYDYAGACKAILMWRNVTTSGVTKDCSVPENKCMGLWKRRLEAHEACMVVQEAG